MRSWWQLLGATPQYHAAPALQPASPQEPAAESEVEPVFRVDFHHEEDEVNASLREIRIW